MNCINYQTLTPKEKTDFIGKLLHAAQSDNGIFLSCEVLIQEAEQKGIYDGVIINPPNSTEPQA